MSKKLDELEKLCEQHAIIFRKCSEFHYQIKGKFTINLYPTKSTMYINGMTEKIGFVSNENIISLAKNGKFKTRVKIKTKTEKRKNNTKSKRKQLWDKGVRACFVCGKSFDSISDTTLEHKIPLSKGGSNRLDNLSLSHEICNIDKGNKI